MRRFFIFGTCFFDHRRPGPRRAYRLNKSRYSFTACHGRDGFLPNNESRALVTRAASTGVPFALLGSMFGVVGITANAFDSKAIYSASAIMFLTILCGGVVSAVGYFALPNEKEVKGSLPVPLMFFCVISFLGLMLWTANVSSGLAQIYSPLALSVFLMTFGWTIVSKRQIGLQELAETSLFSSILTLVVGIILWLEAGIRELSDVSVALNGLLYGLGIYFCIYIVSLSYRDLGEINASRTNWHWMEIPAFIIFLLFAPETIREVLLEQLPS